MKVSVIIVHWNTPEQVIVQSSKFKVQNDIEIILIDNNSTKENINKLKSYRLQDSGYKIIYNDKNLGYAGACNQGAKIAKWEWLLFLNPDTYIDYSSTLKLIKNAEEQNLDAVSPAQEGDNYYKPLPTWLSLAVEFSPLRRLIPLSLFNKHTLFGGCLFIKASVLKKIGGWDEDFFLWFEDSDLTKRLLDNEYKIGWVDVPHHHEGGISFKRLSEEKQKKIFFSSMNLYARKHFSLFGQLVVKVVSWWNLKATSYRLQES